ncbi:AIR synthase-related protein [Nanoarchaeota archaeon]
MTDFSDMSYEASGVSIRDQNKVNSEVSKRLKKHGMDAKGLFGGAVDLSDYKDKKFARLDIGCAPISSTYDHAKEKGKAAFQLASSNLKGKLIGTLDYIASQEMGEFIPDFVEGIALESMTRGCVVLGGESAQMKDTYNQGMFDSFVHVLGINQHGAIDVAKAIEGMSTPLLVASTDGTGTKPKVFRHPRDSTPEDIIAHGFNDISAQGVKPAGFSLYIAGNVPKETLKKIDKKATEIAKRCGVAMLPSTLVQTEKAYQEGSIDIAGTVVGFVDKKYLVTGSDVKPGNVLVGVSVDGLMTNGYTLGRDFSDELVKKGEVKSWDDPMDALNGKSLRYELSRPHRPMNDILFGYEGVEGVVSKFDVKGMAHITGGGQPDNIVRMVPKGCKAVVSKDVLPVPPFMALCRQYGIKDEELYQTFNMGVGYTLTVPKEQAGELVDYINKHFRNRIQDVSREAAQIGVIKKTTGDSQFEFGGRK